MERRKRGWWRHACTALSRASPSATAAKRCCVKGMRLGERTATARPMTWTASTTSARRALSPFSVSRPSTPGTERTRCKTTRPLRSNATKSPRCNDRAPHGSTRMDCPGTKNGYILSPCTRSTVACPLRRRATITAAANRVCWAAERSLARAGVEVTSLTLQTRFFGGAESCHPEARVGARRTSRLPDERPSNRAFADSRCRSGFPAPSNSSSGGASR